MTPLVLGRAPLALPAACAGWLLVALPLLLLGGYRPLPAVLLGGPAAVLLAAAVVRHGPELPGPAWAGWLTLAVVAGFLVLAWGWSGEHVILRRDAGSYALHAQWLATHGRLPIPADRGVFGGLGDPGSPGFYALGGAVVPQFLSGAPLLLAVGGWVGGLPGILHADALLGAAALLAVAGLAARVAGPRAAPFAAAGTGLAYPVLHAARAPYSEPAALLLLAGGLALLAERRRPLLGGLLVGLATLVRIDAPADLLLLVPYAVFAAQGRRVGLGVLAGVAVGVLDGVVLSRPYVASLPGELLGIAAGALLLGAGSWLVRRRRITLPRWAPAAAGALVVLAAVGLWLRPLVQTVHRTTSARFMIGALQAAQGLPRDPTRTYDEYTLHWVAWWFGLPLLLLGVAGFALLVARRVAGDAERYDPAPFLLVLAAAAAVVLLRPSITPDHPWADRRLVPVVLPGLAACAAYTVTAAVRAVRSPRWRPPAAAALAAVALVPELLAAAPLLGAATEHGELAALHRLCAALPPRAAVVVTGERPRNELPQAVRGVCRVPVTSVPAAELAGALPGLRAAASRAGRALVVVADSPTPLRAAGLTPTRVVDLRTREDARLLTRRPTATVPLQVEVWLAGA